MGLRARLRHASRIASAELTGRRHGYGIPKGAPSFDRSLMLIVIVMVILLCTALLLPDGNGDMTGNSSSPVSVIGLHPR